MTDEATRLPLEGEIVEWQLRDEITLEPCMAAATREDLRILKRDCGGIIVKVVVTH